MGFAEILADLTTTEHPPQMKMFNLNYTFRLCNICYINLPSQRRCQTIKCMRELLCIYPANQTTDLHKRLNNTKYNFFLNETHFCCSSTQYLLGTYFNIFVTVCDECKT